MNAINQLEELAKWHDSEQARMGRRSVLSHPGPTSLREAAEADRHREFAAAIRAAISDCKVGELVKQMVEKHGSFAVDTVSRKVRVGTIRVEHGGYRHRVVAEASTLQAAVEAARSPEPQP